MKDLSVGLWFRSLTPTVHTQTELMGFAVNARSPGSAFWSMPVDINMPDDDAVYVPVALAAQVIENSQARTGRRNLRGNG